MFEVSQKAQIENVHFHFKYMILYNTEKPATITFVTRRSLRVQVLLHGLTKRIKIKANLY